MLIYFACETAVFIFFGFKTQDKRMVSFSKSCAEYDPVTGYRWTCGPVRFTRIINNEVVYDNVFPVNNMGFPSRRDFFSRKKNNAYRIIVLGDSFSSGEYLSVPWPERLEQLLRAANPGRNIEVYNFSLSGCGLPFWDSIMKYLAARGFEYDALVIALYNDDIFRDFTVFQGKYNRIYYTAIPADKKTPAQKAEFIRDYFPYAEKLADVVPDDVIAVKAAAIAAHEKRHWITPPLRLRIPEIIGGAIVKYRHDARYPGGRRILKPALPPDTTFKTLSIVDYYGKERLWKLQNIVDPCRKKKIPVIVSALPARDSLKRRGKWKSVHDEAVPWKLAITLGAYFHDGYAPFARAGGEAASKAYFFKYDDHWNQAGADKYASDIASFILSAGILSK